MSTTSGAAGAAYDVAIVGTGGIAAIHARDLAELGERARIVTAVDTDAGRLDDFSRRWSVPRTYAALESMLEFERPDVVVLCTPPGLHTGQALTCLEHGVTVLCEKPPALSLAEMDTIIGAERADAGDGRFATVFQHRFGSGAESLRRLVGDPRLGPPMTAVCHTLWYRPDDYFAAPWRGVWGVEGGGPTMGHGIHQMDLLLSVLGPWRDVSAVAARRARPTDTEDFSAALVTFDSGVVATVVNSLLSPRETSYLRFDFAHATVELEHLYGYDDASWRVSAAPEHEDTVAAAWAEGPKGRGSGHAAQYTALFDALDAGAPPPVTTADARDTMELVAAIYASSFTGQTVRRGDLGPGSPFYDRMNGDGAPWAAAKETEVPA
ncbi:gfo/Idh/MocA family oxidoreductase [Actinobacteria bacterium YIM 96077]|uniref:Gfo/Idh/MocA family oxidoreductase n=1 Tax=Phytoactinopolyspora halophila TaxID=1981511 RepID=A0A329QG23_9ACTN|nr:Gfo/Idh/MocA family oxidoreductase [Phytoactinopolyspora halophila]AYY14031.1 gfo/Idh/MocA family oxidoreductase [Actinobacteria bacterium YIM 96077]RAW10282.1 gfo/Idh/MocA family oxidoreductase [Phytoactinopolyspora halophila]